MRLTITGNLRPVLRDLKEVRKTSVKASIAALNRVSQRKVETPAVKRIAKAKQVTAGVVRWKHDINGARTDRRRLRRQRARQNREWVGWYWAHKGGEPGKVSVISLPGRRQTRKGVKAGRAGPVIPGGFIQTAKATGQLGAFRRTGRERYPIQFLRVDLTDTADRIFSALVRRSGPAYKAEYNRLLELRLRRTASRIVRRRVVSQARAVSPI